MYYTDQFQKIFHELSQFITANQAIILTAMLIMAYFAKRFIDRKAADPQSDIYDRLKPGSDALYKYIHAAVDKAALVNPLSSAAKLVVFMQKLAEFEAAYSKDKLQAVKSLIAWHLSIEAKKAVDNVAANPSLIGPDDEAV